MTNSIVEYMGQEAVSKNIQETLGKKTPQFIASVTSLVNANEVLRNAEKKSVMLACLTAAALDLPINQNLGFAYIIPYKNKKGDVVAQFQMGWKGFVQLAMRSGQFETINVSDVRAGEIGDESRNRLTGEIIFTWEKDEKKRAMLPVIGFVAYMRLINGFKKMLYMTSQELDKHGNRYSQSMKKGYGLWKDDFDAMASKTVIKLLLSKYAPMTVEMQRATLADQAVVGDNDYDHEYVDNETPTAGEIANHKEQERILIAIKEAKNLKDLEECRDAVGDDGVLSAVFSRKFDQLAQEKK
ncbi:MAG: recombinase RecT [Patescibacteria group bacterium]